MAMELHHLNTHGMMEQACDVRQKTYKPINRPVGQRKTK